MIDLVSCLKLTAKSAVCLTCIPRNLKLGCSNLEMENWLSNGTITVS